MDQICGPAVGEDRIRFERPGKTEGGEQRFRDDRDTGRILRYGDNAGVPQQGQSVRERADVIKTVAGEIAVVDEKDIHAEEGRKPETDQRA